MIPESPASLGLAQVHCPGFAYQGSVCFLAKGEVLAPLPNQTGGMDEE